MADFAISEDSDLLTYGCQEVSFVETKHKAGESRGRAPVPITHYRPQPS